MKKSYYAIIPADVRYSDKICANSKLLYGEITALCNEKGFCWASNSYFAELYGKSNRSISSWLSQLNEAGFINLVIEGKQPNLQRKIYIAENNSSTPLEENFHPPEKKTSNRILQSNTTVNNISRLRFTPPTLESIKSYCDHRNNKIDPQQFYDFYESKGWMICKNNMKDWKACIRTWERKNKPTTPKPDAMTRLKDQSWADHLLETNQ